MTKKSEKPSAGTPGNNTNKAKVNTDISVINPDKITCQDDGMIVLVRENVPHVYWLALYRELGLTASHADDVIQRLTPGKHYIKLTREEIKPLLDSIANAAIPAVKTYYFLTAEGWNRALLEIDTDPMLNREAADYIEATKDKMANVYTRYNQGEVLFLKGDTQKSLPKFVPGAGILRDRLRQAQAYEKYIGCSKKEAVLICLKIADEDHKRIGGSGFSALIEKAEQMPDDKKRLLPAHTGLYVSVTKIGKALGVSGQLVNKYLDKLGYQESVGGEHTPNDIGIPYSKWEEITISKSDGSQVVRPHLIWSVEIIDILRVHIEAEQATLPGCESV